VSEQQTQERRCSECGRSYFIRDRTVCELEPLDAAVAEFEGSRRNFWQLAFGADRGLEPRTPTGTA
jgi:hypothetical protein